MTPFRKPPEDRPHAAPPADWEEHGHQLFQDMEKGEHVLEYAMIGVAVLIAAALGARLLFI
jgi:hypothetical protein